MNGFICESAINIRKICFDNLYKEFPESTMSSFSFRIYCSISEIINKFGEYDDSISDDGKVTTSWMFIDESTGDYVYIYDNKKTCMYSHRLMTVTQFRKQFYNNPIDWCVNSNDDAFAERVISNVGLI